LLAAAIVGGLGWCAERLSRGALASARPAASRADVVLLVLAPWWCCGSGSRSRDRSGTRRTSGPMIDEGSLDEPLLPVISVAYYVDVIVVAITLVGLATSRLVACRAPNRSVSGVALRSRHPGFVDLKGRFAHHGEISPHRTLTPPAGCPDAQPSSCRSDARQLFIVALQATSRSADGPET
jgi:hypothetical protein